MQENIKKFTVNLETGDIYYNGLDREGIECRIFVSDKIEAISILQEAIKTIALKDN